MLIYQPSNGYRFNTDTLLLYNYMSEMNLKGNLLEVGSGCGILSLLLKRDFSSKIDITTIEIQKSFYKLTDKNFKVNGYSATHINSDFTKHDFTSNKFDYIFSNPPFYHENVKKSSNNNKNIARYNDNLPLDKMIVKVKQLLKNRGEFIMCYDYKQLQDLLYILKQHKLTVESIQFVYNNVVELKCNLVIVMARNSSNSLLHQEKPLFLYENGVFSDELKKIYLKSKTHTIRCDISQI